MEMTNNCGGTGARLPVKLPKDHGNISVILNEMLLDAVLPVEYNESCATIYAKPSHTRKKLNARGDPPQENTDVRRET